MIHKPYIFQYNQMYIFFLQNVLRRTTELIITASLVLYVVDEDISSLYVWTTSSLALT